MPKTRSGLVKWCYDHLGTNYVYGMKMSIMTLADYNNLKKMYGSAVWDSDKNKVGTLCCDCSGLISSYTGIMRSSSNYKAVAKNVNSISNLTGIKEGDLLWLQGHIGVYVGEENGVHYYIAEDGSARGTVKLPLSKQKWTHWFECVDLKEDNMTQQEFDTLYNNTNPFYKTLEDVPKYWQADVKELMEKGIIAGDGVNPVGKRKEVLEAIVVAKRIQENR